MRRFVIIIFAAVICLTIVCCEGPSTVHNTGLYEAHYIVDANVPYADDINSHKIDLVYELEQDEYGRRLFKYTTYSRILGVRIDLHIISQETSDTVLAYYQDYCYLVSVHDEDTVSEEELLTFKELNDWNKPLNSEKITCISSDYTRPLLYENDILLSLCEYLGLSERAHCAYNELECLSDARQLYSVRIIDKNEDDIIVFDKCFLIIANLELDGYIEACEEFDPVPSCQNTIHEFREKYLQIE